MLGKTSEQLASIVEDQCAQARTDFAKDADGKSCELFGNGKSNPEIGVSWH